MRLLAERASCRAFADRKIPHAVLKSILSTATHGATGGNLQPYSIIQIQDAERRKQLAKLCGQSFMAKAPAHLLFCIDWNRLHRWAELEVAPFSATSSFRHFWISFQDTVISAQTVCVAADSMGLGSVYVGTIMEFLDEARRMFELPDGVFPVVLLCLGYPKTELQPRKKLGVDVVVHKERYHELEDEQLLGAFNEKYDHQRIPITQNRIKTIRRACRAVHGEQFARRCVRRIRRQGYISAVQRYFGLHYRADFMREGNEEFLSIMREFGFDWLEPTSPDRVA
jgi:FMN reductase [NAD(P)H]